MKDETKKLATVSLASHEVLMYRANRRTKAWMITSGILFGIVVALLVGSPPF